MSQCRPSIAAISGAGARPLVRISSSRPLSRNRLTRLSFQQLNETSNHFDCSHGKCLVGNGGKETRIVAVKNFTFTCRLTTHSHPVASF